MRELLGIITIMVLFIGSIIWACYHMEKASCDNYSEITTLDTKYYLNGGCFVKSIDGNWVHWKQIMEIN